MLFPTPYPIFRGALASYLLCEKLKPLGGHPSISYRPIKMCTCMVPISPASPRCRGNTSRSPSHLCMASCFPTLFLTISFHLTTVLFPATYKHTLAPSDMKNHFPRILRIPLLPPQQNISECCLYSLSPCPHPCNLHFFNSLRSDCHPLTSGHQCLLVKKSHRRFLPS